MGEKPDPEKKKLPMKTRLIIILITFVIINVIFYLVFDGSDESSENEEIEQENVEVPEQTNEEQEYFKFNPPKPET